MNDPTATLDRLIAGSDQLYSLPAVAMEVLELTSNPRVDARVLKECIENDPALTGKILRVVNSSLFGLSREVSDLNQALALLGTKPLKLLVLGFSLPDGLFANVAGEILGHYWRHALTKAVAAREISQTLWDTPGDDAFIAGLLQDLGLLLLIQKLGEPYVKLLEKVYADGGDLAVLETSSLSFDHTALTARLLAQWGLPETLVDAVASDESSTPTASEGGSLRQIVHLAELMARLLADGRTDALEEILATGRRMRNLTEKQLEALVESLQEKVEQLADVLRLQLPEGLDFRDVLARAHGQLAGVAAEVAEDMVRDGQSKDQRRDEASMLIEVQRVAEAVADVARGPQPGSSMSPAIDSPTHRERPATHKAPVQAPSSRQPAAVAVDPGLLGRLEIAVGNCRHARCSLSLLLVELNHHDELILTRGTEGFDYLHQFLGTLCRRLDTASAMCIEYGEAGYAVIASDYERRAAVELGEELLDSMRRATAEAAGERPAVSISIGVATVSLPPKNFPADDLLTSAARCLYGSHASGGSVVKSIEIY